MAEQGKWGPIAPIVADNEPDEPELWAYFETQAEEDAWIEEQVRHDLELFPEWDEAETRERWRSAFR